MTDRLKDRLDSMEIPSPDAGLESRIIQAALQRKSYETPKYFLRGLIGNKSVLSGSLAVVLGLFVLVFIFPSSHKSDVSVENLSELIVDDGGLDDFVVFDEEEFLF